MRTLAYSLLLATVALVSSPPASSAAGLKVLHSDTQHLDLEWSLDRTTFVTVPGEGRSFRRPDFPGALHLAGPGEPDLPSIVELIGLPREGEARVRVLSVETVAEPVPDLAPGPEPVVEPREGGGSRLYERRTRIAPTAGFSPGRWVEIGTPVSMRGSRVARVVIHPWRYDSARGELEWARRLRIRVDFGDAGQRPSAGQRVPDYPSWEQAMDAVLLNSEVARAWRRPRSAAPGFRAAGDSFDSSAQWLRVPITKSGVYQIDYFTFNNIGLDAGNIDPTTIRVFSGTNLQLPADYSTFPPDFMTECALLHLVDGGQDPDEIFDLDERFLFYALAPNGWASQYDPSLPRTQHVENQYTDISYYWITWGGSFSAPPKRMVTRDVAPADSVFARSGPHRLHFEENNVDDFRYRSEDGWMWESLHGRGTDRLYLLDVDRVAGAGDGVIRTRLLSHGDLDPEFRVRDVELKVQGQIVADSIWTHGSLRAVVDLSGCFTGLLTNGPNSIRVNAKTDDLNSVDKIYTTWFDIEYDRLLQPENGSFLSFFADPVPPADVTSACSLFTHYGRTSFLLQGFHSSTIYLFDVSDQHDVVQLDGFTTTDTGPWGVRFSDAPLTGVRWYVATTMEGVLPLAPAEKVDIRGLRDSNQGAEYVVIYHPDFRNGAERLASMRRDLSWRPRSATAVNVEDIYNEFSWGMKDPVAIRDFLGYASRNWLDPPLFVTLVGDAAYDTKKFLDGSPENFLGTYVNRYREEALTDYAAGDNLNFYSTDDFFTYLDPADYQSGSPAQDLAIGRYPIGTPAELEIELDKLESYLDYEMSGQWQNRVMLTADDERTLSEGVREPIHTNQVETLSRERVPPSMDRVKIYLTEFPRNDFGKKPDAQEKFIDEFTRGALMVTYTGHGDQNTMAQEEVFVSQKIPELLNEDRYPVFSTFSCTVSRFDLLSGNSMTELLLLHEGGGAVTTFASGGLVFPTPSATLNQEWLGEMFGTPYLVPTFARTVRPLGLAAMTAKVITQTSTSERVNNEKYVLLGDPALELRFGRHPVVFDSTTVATQTVEGNLRVIRGSVRDETGAVLDGTAGTTPFNGTAFAHVTENADTSGYTYDQGHIDYVLEGSTTYRGEVPVVDGRFEVKFFLSEAVKTGNRARISVFALEEGLGRDASGAYDSLVIAPTIAPSEADKEGPGISIAFEGYENFVTGDFLFTDKPILVVRLEDESGINLRPFPEFALLGAEIDGRDRINLSEDFTYVEGSFTRGRVRRILPMSPGVHKVEVKAFDNVGNRTSVDVEFTVVLPSVDFGIEDRFVAVYPNPFVQETYFLFRLTHPAEVDLKVFTITGRKIRQVAQAYPATAGNNRISWNGLDENGRPLANGTYLYKVEARYTDGAGNVTTDEHVGHVVKMR